VRHQGAWEVPADSGVRLEQISLTEKVEIDGKLLYLRKTEARRSGEGVSEVYKESPKEESE